MILNWTYALHGTCMSKCQQIIFTHSISGNAYLKCMEHTCHLKCTSMCVEICTGLHRAGIWAAWKSTGLHGAGIWGAWKRTEMHGTGIQCAWKSTEMHGTGVWCAWHWNAWNWKFKCKDCMEGIHITPACSVSNWNLKVGELHLNWIWSAWKIYALHLELEDAYKSTEVAWEVSLSCSAIVISSSPSPVIM